MPGYGQVPLSLSAAVVHIESGRSLQAFNSFGVPASARRYLAVESAGQLAAWHQQRLPCAEPLLILGGGSNILFTQDVEGLVLHNRIGGMRVLRKNADHVWVEAGGGVNWHQLVRWTVQEGWGGLENLSLIPGSAGAAPVQNIGAYGAELKDVFEELTAFELRSGRLQRFRAADCHFDYRDSIFKRELNKRVLITSIILRLNRRPKLNLRYDGLRDGLAEEGIREPTVADVSRVVCRIRQRKLPDPSAIGNAGSFFKNPVVEPATYERLRANEPGLRAFPLPDGQVKLAAAWLIERAGWKGVRRGNTGTYDKHALVLVNHGGATGQEVYALSEAIIRSVAGRFGIWLEREVNVV